MLRVLCVLSVLLASCSGGRLPQKYLPPRAGAASNQQLHYHGVSGQGHPVRTGPAFAPAPAHGHAHAQGGYQRGGHAGAGAQIPIVRSDYQSDANGNYNFGFDTGNGIHRDETGEFKGGWPHGSLGVRGSYSYTGDDGKQYTVNYKADKNGFHAEGAHLPTSPSLPHGQPQAGGYHAAASHQAHAPSSRYLPPGGAGGAAGYNYSQRRHYRW